MGYAGHLGNMNLKLEHASVSTLLKKANVILGRFQKRFTRKN